MDGKKCHSKTWRKYVKPVKFFTVPTIQKRYTKKQTNKQKERMQHKKQEIPKKNKKTKRTRWIIRRMQHKNI